MGRNKSELLDKAIAAKQKVVDSAKELAGRVKKNIEQGQKDYRAGKVGYGSINIFKK